MAVTYVERGPPRALSAFLECLWEVSDDRRLARRPPDRIVPDGCPELIVHLGDPFARRVGRRWVRQPAAFLAGTLTRPWTLRAGRHVWTIGLRFKPGAAAALFGLDMQRCTDRELPLAAMVGAAEADRLVRALSDARTRLLRFRAAAAWLAPRAITSRPHPGSAQPAIARILRARGCVPIADVATATRWTRRRLERAFLRDVGVRPKLFARIVRLNAVLAAVGEGQRAALVDLALATGYFDQSHLLRDFRALVGRGPQDGRHADGHLARHFTDPKRLRTLLDGD